MNLAFSEKIQTRKNLIFRLKVSFFNTEYANSTSIEELVRDTAAATNRGMERVNEWCARLKAQDIMNVGDLRDLHDEDWSSLYVFSNLAG